MEALGTHKTNRIFKKNGEFVPLSDMPPHLQGFNSASEKMILIYIMTEAFSSYLEDETLQAHCHSWKETKHELIY